MYQFIEDNFHPQQKFIERAAKAATIRWNLTSHEIDLVSGLNEIPGIDINHLAKFTSEDQFIHGIVPHEIYQKHRLKIAEFFRIRVKNNTKRFLINFALNHTQRFNDLTRCSFVYLYIDKEKDSGQFTVTSAETARKLNDKISLLSI